jgi:hypothetical protein
MELKIVKHVISIQRYLLVKHTGTNENGDARKKINS